MGADRIVLTADSAQALSVRTGHTRNQRQPVFWIALSCAAAVHAALLLGLARSSPRYLGDPSGSKNAIDVEIVDAAELRGKTRRPSAPVAQPAAPAAQTASSAAETPLAEPTPPSESAPSQQTAAVPALETEKPKAPLSADKAAKPAPPKDSAKKEEDKREEERPERARLKPPEQLDLSLPWNLAMQGGSSGGDSSASRPPGITRSGENDRFGRAVIRALKKTMPHKTGIKSRVTIRLFLNKRGNVAKLRLVQSGGNQELDQDVLFSARQTSFPFPPKGATVADRTFLVTYVYR